MKKKKDLVAWAKEEEKEDAHKHRKHKKGFAKNRKEEELEQEGKAKHYKHKKTACKACGSMKHATSEHKMEHKHYKGALPSPHHFKHHKKHESFEKRFDKMRKKVFGLK